MKFILRPKTQLATTTKIFREENELDDGVFLPKFFLILQGEVEFLAENPHAYVGKVSFLSKRPL